MDKRGKLFTCMTVAILVIIQFLGCTQKKDFSFEMMKKQHQVINGNSSLAVPPRMLELSIGAVRPEGWIRDWAMAASQGVTGHLDEYSPLHLGAWTGINIKATGAGPEGTGWPLEQGAYWLDGAVRLGYILNDSALIGKISKRLDIIVDGILSNDTIHSFIYWKPNDFVSNDGFNSWSHSHMGRTLVAYYQATGDQRILDALLQVYRDYPLPSLPSNFRDVTGAVNLDAMIQTFLFSGDSALANRIKSATGDKTFCHTVSLWNTGKIESGHGVIAYENCRIPAMAYLFSGNSNDLDATKTLLRNFDENHLLANDIASSEEWMAGIGSTRNIETCNVATAPLLYQKLMEVTGDGTFGDRIERVFFNAVPVAASRDCKDVTYYQSLNKVENVLPGDFPKAPMDISPRGARMSSYDYHPIGHTVLCCVGNYTRSIPNYIMNMWMATADNGLAATLYGPCQVDTYAGKRMEKVTIESQTNYPFEENILLTFTSGKTVEFPLYIRIPSWCKAATVTVNGKLQTIDGIDQSFLKIDRKWQKGDRIELNFPMEPCLVNGHETNYPKQSYFVREQGEEGLGRALAERTNIDYPFQYVNYGPLLFSLPLRDISLNQMDNEAKWNYALKCKDVQKDIRVQRTNFPTERWSWQLDQSPVTLEVNAGSFDWKPTLGQPLPAGLVKTDENRTIRLVPYGCTHYRISLFPVAE